MKVIQSDLEGLEIIKLEVRQDDRGLFIKPYSINEAISTKGFDSMAEVFYSVSRLDVIRGMHFQIPPFAQKKIVTVITGSILDVILDIRKHSSTFGKSVSLKLTANDGQCLLIPEGLAHGFLSLEEKTTVMYMVDKPYSPNNECGIRYDSFGFKWPVENPILSERDKSFIRFDGFNSPFEVM